MTRYSNGTKATIWFRDDAGKHEIEPGDEIELSGEQHAPAALDAGLEAEPEPDETPTPIASRRSRRESAGSGPNPAGADS